MTIYSFLDNKYTRWYYSIIDRRRANPAAGYTERHHVIPRSLGGEDEDNIVRLLAREHYICHRLLVKMTEGTAKKKMQFTAYSMLKWKKHTQTFRITSKTYAILREDYSNVARQAVSKFRRGRPLSEEHKQAIGKSLQGRKLSPEHVEKTRLFHLGRKRSEETVQKIRASMIGKQCRQKKLWVLLNPQQTRIETFDLKKFCQVNKLGLSKLLETQKTKKPVEKGFSTGWMIVGFSLHKTAI